MQFKNWVELKRGRATAVSKAIGVPPSFVSKMVSGEKAIPAEHCKTIEQMSDGLVTCQELRPNDWQKYWPELAQAPASPVQEATETVAVEAAPVAAIRAGRVRRLAERRAIGGSPFQINVVGEA